MGLSILDILAQSALKEEGLSTEMKFKTLNGSDVVALKITDVYDDVLKVEYVDGCLYHRSQ